MGVSGRRNGAMVVSYPDGRRETGCSVQPPRLRAAPLPRWGSTLLTDFPLGTWMSASLLDLVGGRQSRTASRRLITFGVAAALPTMAAGWTDWLAATRAQRRVGIVHAATNSTALSLYVASLAARRRGHHRPGVALGIAGG